MAEEQDNAVIVLLREIRAGQLEHSAKLATIETRVRHLEKHIQEFHSHFLESKQGLTYDDLFAQLEKILANEKHNDRTS
jgi:flagellar biosynthesis chaperone FliJ